MKCPMCMSSCKIDYENDNVICRDQWKKGCQWWRGHNGSPEDDVIFKKRLRK